MWKNTNIVVNNKNYKVDVFLGIVDETRSRTQTGISGGSLNTDKYGSSSINTTHINFQEVWLTGDNGAEASISLKNKDIQARKGNLISLVRVEDVNYWAINKTTNTKYQLSENPSSFLLPKDGCTLWILALVSGILTFLSVIGSKVYNKFMGHGWMGDLFGLSLVIVFPFVWFLIPYLNIVRKKNEKVEFDKKFDSILSNAIISMT